jgi:hypothetical protein
VRREMLFYRSAAVLLTVVLAMMLCWLVFDFGRKSASTASGTTPAPAALDSQAQVDTKTILSVELTCEQVSPEAKAGHQQVAPRTVKCRVPAAALAAAAGSALTGLNKDADPPRSIDSSINVIAIVIAMVTLILTVGTSWFSQKQVEIAQMMKDLEQRRELSELLVHARTDLLQGLSETIGSASILANEGQLLAAQLELLQSPNEESRKRAFLSLKPFFGESVVGQYPHLLRYTIACSRLAPKGAESYCDLFDLDI